MLSNSQRILEISNILNSFQSIRSRLSFAQYLDQMDKIISAPFLRSSQNQYEQKTIDALKIKAFAGLSTKTDILKTKDAIIGLTKLNLQKLEDFEMHCNRFKQSRGNLVNLLDGFSGGTHVKVTLERTERLLLEIRNRINNLKTIDELNEFNQTFAGYKLDELVSELNNDGAEQKQAQQKPKLVPSLPQTIPTSSLSQKNQRFSFSSSGSSSSGSSVITISPQSQESPIQDDFSARVHASEIEILKSVYKYEKSSVKTLQELVTLKKKFREETKLSAYKHDISSAKTLPQLASLKKLVAELTAVSVKEKLKFEEKIDKREIEILSLQYKNEISFAKTLGELATLKKKLTEQTKFAEQIKLTIERKLEIIEDEIYKSALDLFIKCKEEALKNANLPKDINDYFNFFMNRNNLTNYLREFLYESIELKLLICPLGDQSTLRAIAVELNNVSRYFMTVSPLFSTEPNPQWKKLNKLLNEKMTQFNEQQSLEKQTNYIARFAPKRNSQ